MKQRKFKHSEVAKILGVSRATVYNWQREPYTWDQVKARIDQMREDLTRAEAMFGLVNERMDAEERLDNV